MLEFLSSNRVWIFLIGGMLYMHLGHGRGHGGHMGCGAHQHSGSEHQPADKHSAGDGPAGPHERPSADRHH